MISSVVQMGKLRFTEREDLPKNIAEDKPMCVCLPFPACWVATSQLPHTCPGAL